ncbi:MAG: beta-ketoacyl synthase N-terminal-like domain-containing protein, partial [Stackebrandtia sp.]
ASGRPQDRAGLRAHVLRVFRDVLGVDVAGDRPLYEQGVDSVRLPRLAAELQRSLNRPMSTTTLLSHPTVDALVDALAASRPAAASAAPRAHASADDRRVAVIGMAGRFPGADSVDAFWDNLRRGVESIRRFSPQQLAAAGVPPAKYERPDYVPASGVLGAGDAQAVADFAADLFGVSAREATLTDPQQRLFLECCHELLERAGYAAGGERIGVFAGSGMNLYSHHTYLLGNLRGELSDPLGAMQAAMGNQPDFLATRAAYRLNLTGPAINVQTACSTGLVAVHLAVQSLLAGDSDVAVAGASAVHIPQTTGYTYMDGSILSSSGRCRPFDAAADGTVGGNGVAAVALKRLDRALADGDTVHAVVLGSAVNNDGADKVGFTAPSVSGQVAAVTAALDAAGVTSDTVGYVEAHGTGTALGDPLEIQALTEAFAARAAAGSDEPHCAIGAVKANVGHLDSCAGIAGLVKAALVLREGIIPPQINFDQLNPAISLEDGPFFISSKETEWPQGRHPRRAGVQALGVGGTNAHVILEAPPPRTPPEPAARYANRPALVLSGQTEAALDELAAEFAERLRRPDAPEKPDLLASTALGRRHRRHRLVAWGDAAADVADALDARRVEASSPDVVYGEADAEATGPVGFVFSGQGGLRAGFARELYDSSEAFKAVLDRCAERYRAKWDGDLLTPLLDSAESPPQETDLVQPALFAFQTALAEAWASLGVRPDFVAGHSVGEYAAWCVAGGMSVEDGLDLTVRRGRSMQELTAPGAMAAARADRRAVEAVRAVVSDVDLAVVNGARDHVLAGEPEAVAEAVRLLERRDVIVRMLPARRAFHSALLDPMLPHLREAASAVTFTPVVLPVASTVDGAMRPSGTVADAEYFCRQTRGVARWDLAVDALADAGCRLFLEIGPDAVLTSMGRRNLPQARWLASHPPEGGGLPRALAGLHCAGLSVDWRPLAFDGGRVPLPTHPLHRKTYWIDPTPADPTHFAQESSR